MWRLQLLILVAVDDYLYSALEWRHDQTTLIAVRSSALFIYDCCKLYSETRSNAASILTPLSCSGAPFKVVYEMAPGKTFDPFAHSRYTHGDSNQLFLLRLAAGR